MAQKAPFQEMKTKWSTDQRGWAKLEDQKTTLWACWDEQQAHQKMANLYTVLISGF